MGYDLHIVRTKDWLEAKTAPITKEDVDSLIASDAELAWSAEDYVDMSDDAGAVNRYFMIQWNGDSCFWWYKDEIRCTNPDEAQQRKIGRMAQTLGAYVVGDDGELYEPPVTLEKQIEKLAELGLRLNQGMTADDMLRSFERDQYEKSPFDLVLFVFGIEVECEPWGRYFSSSAWNFDTECITSTGDYTAIVKRLCEISGAPDYLTDISDFVDLDSGEAWLKYKVNGIERHWKVEVNDDWADSKVVSSVMKDIERGGKRFYGKDNGQAMVLFFLDSGTASKLNELSNNALALVDLKQVGDFIPQPEAPPEPAPKALKPWWKFW